MTRLLCVVALVACSGKPSAPAHPAPRGAGSGVEARPEENRPVAAREDDTTCDKLIEHVVALAVAERPADQKPTDAERADIGTQLRAAWSPKCQQMTAKGYDCTIAARTLAELDRCGG